MIRFLQSHRSVGAVLHRTPLRSWVSRRVWRELEADPVFVARVAEGRADIAAGRVVPWTEPVP